jgi:predicted DNA-binding transcriptional regulator AlpA
MQTDHSSVTISPESLDQLAAAIAARLRADKDRLLALPELAERLSLSERGVTGLVARGELPQGYLIGGSRRWEWAEVLKFLQARQGRKPRRRRRGQYDRSNQAAG